MEVDEIQTQNQTQTPQQQPCKYSRVNSNGRIDSSKLEQGGGEAGGGGSNGGTHNHSNNGVVGPTTTALATASAARAMTGGGGLLGGEMVVGSNGTNSRFGRQWQHSSRIIRVSRASGGKDRHSKVWTAKGPRDRRVRLSVTTAIQFYDLQDRLGYDQPSKAVDWLIKAASEAINELPSLNTASFPPETPRQLSDERKSGGCNNGMVDDSGDTELLDGEINLGQNNQQQQQQMGSKSGCSSNNSETSKGSGLSLWRSEIRVKARERARERTAKEKERDAEPSSMLNVAASHQQQHQHQQQNVSSMAQTSSFTQLLTAGMNNLNESNNGGAASSSPSAEMGLFHKHSRGGGSSGGGGGNNNNNNQWLSSTTSTTQMADYFGSGLMGLISASRAGQMGLGSNTSSLPQVMTIASFGSGSENQHHHQSHHDQLHQQHHNPHHHPSQQLHFPFISDQHLIQVANAAPGANGGGGGGGGGGNDYNLNFSMSSTSTTSSAALAAAAGYNNRGTLQSNSPSLLPYLQRFSAATDGSSLPFFLGSAAVSTASPTVNHHQHHQHQQFQPPGLQLCYGDGGRQSDQKGKGKN